MGIMSSSVSEHVLVDALRSGKPSQILPAPNMFPAWPSVTLCIVALSDLEAVVLAQLARARAKGRSAAKSTIARRSLWNNPEKRLSRCASTGERAPFEPVLRLQDAILPHFVCQRSFLTLAMDPSLSTTSVPSLRPGSRPIPASREELPPQQPHLLHDRSSTASASLSFPRCSLSPHLSTRIYREDQGAPRDWPDRLVA